jgi:hypothetical protein
MKKCLFFIFFEKKTIIFENFNYILWKLSRLNRLLKNVEKKMATLDRSFLLKIIYFFFLNIFLKQGK